MTIREMITAITDGVITDRLVNALVEFMWDYDPYGIMDYYGHIDDDGVREQLANEVRFCLDEEETVLLDNLNDALGNPAFRENY